MIQTQTRAAAAPLDDLVAAAVPETTRIFVSGLPPKFTSEQLAGHFGSHFKVTDAHVITDRRIGFVGLTDSQAAKNAAEHFHKSFIRMSKISVDLAKPVEVSRNRQGNAIPISQKRQRGDRYDETRKRKRLNEDGGEAQRSSSIEKQDQELREIEQKKSAPVAEEDMEETINAATNDNDWLRGRTTRTLDLVDQDDIHVQQDDDAQEADTDDKDPSANTMKEALLLEAASETTRVPNSRLFLRNLAFSINEDDLRRQFRSFGKVQEVREIAWFSISQHDDLLIGTTYAYAYDLTWKEYFSRCFSHSDFGCFPTISSKHSTDVY